MYGWNTSKSHWPQGFSMSSPIWLKPQWHQALQLVHHRWSEPAQLRLGWQAALHCHECRWAARAAQYLQVGQGWDLGRICLNTMTGWWFGTCFFPCIGNNTPIWRIFFRGVETTNQMKNQGQPRCFIRIASNEVQVLEQSVWDSPVVVEWCATGDVDGTLRHAVTPKTINWRETVCVFLWPAGLMAFEPKMCTTRCEKRCDLPDVNVGPFSSRKEQNNRFVYICVKTTDPSTDFRICWYVKNRPIQFLRIPNTQLPASSMCPVLMVVSTLQEATKMPCSISHQSSAEAFALLLLGALVSRLVGSPACPVQLSMGPPTNSVKSTTQFAAQAELPWWVEWSC